MVGRVSNEAVTAVGLFWRQPFSTRMPLMVFFVIIRTEVPVARNKYPEEAVEKIRGDGPASVILRARRIESDLSWYKLLAGSRGFQSTAYVYV